MNGFPAGYCQRGVANYTADPTPGVAPLFFQFTDQSPGDIAS
jgi:PKD repeat protein